MIPACSSGTTYGEFTLLRGRTSSLAAWGLMLRLIRCGRASDIEESSIFAAFT